MTMTSPAPARPSPSPSPTQARPKIRTVRAVINPAAGSVGPDAEAIVSELGARFGCDLTVDVLEPHAVVRTLRAAVDAGPDLILVLAGDGTAGLAATLCGPDGPLVAPLAGGTLNMLPHAIYGKRPWQDALLATLETGVERSVSGGQVDGRPFYCAAILGSPALFAPVREAARAGQLQKAWRRAAQAVRHAFAGNVHYRLDGARKARSAKAMALIAPLVSQAMTEETGLEAAAFDMESARDLVRLAFNGLISNWRDDPGVIAEVCRRGRIESRHSIPALLDGEIQRLPKSVSFGFTPKAFRALAPPVVATPAASAAAIGPPA